MDERIQLVEARAIRRGDPEELEAQAGRPQDLADIQRLLATTPATERASTRNLIERYTPHLVEYYDSLVTLADLEFGSPPHEDQQD